LKSLKLFLESEEEESVNIGLARLVKPMPDYELFFQMNRTNDFTFSRIKDLEIVRTFYHYYHTVFEAYHEETKNCIRFVSNRSIKSEQKKEINMLFSDEEDVNFLLPDCKDVDYIIKTSDNIAEFSLILLPENMMFQIQNLELTSDDELFHLIQYYE